MDTNRIKELYAGQMSARHQSAEEERQMEQAHQADLAAAREQRVENRGRAFEKMQSVVVPGLEKLQRDLGDKFWFNPKARVPARTEIYTGRIAWPE